MSNDEKLVVEKRVRLGSAECRRLRKQGLVPGNIYGHGDEPTAIRVSRDDLMPLIMGRARVIDITCEGTDEKALLRDIQWDTFGTYVQHFDLIRVNPNERIVVEVPLEVRGTSPGVLDGGVFEMQSRTLAVQCPTYLLPESITVRISSLKLGGVLHASDIPLPQGVELDGPGDAVICQVREVHESEETGEGLGGAVEPELIGRSQDDEG